MNNLGDKTYYFNNKVYVCSAPNLVEAVVWFSKLTMAAGKVGGAAAVKIENIWNETDQKWEYPERDTYTPDPQISEISSKLILSAQLAFGRRCTGRTTKTKNNLRVGDGFVVPSNQAARENQSYSYTTIVAATMDDLTRNLCGTNANRILFDHAALEQIYSNEINTISNRLKLISSGKGVAV